MSRPTDLRKTVPGFAQMLRRFWPYLRPYRLLVFGAFAALFAQVGLRLLEPWPLKVIFDRVLVPTPVQDALSAPLATLPPLTILAVAAGALVFVTALRALSEYAATVAFALVGNRVLTEIRGDLYRHLQRLSLGFHHSAKGGDLTLRVVGDVGLLKEIAVTANLPLLGHLLVLVGMLAVMLALNWQLALVGLAVLPLFWLVSTRQGKRIHGEARKQRQREGAMAATTAESMAAIKLVQAMSLEESFAEQFTSQNDKSFKEGLKLKRLAAGLERSVDVLIALGSAAVLYLGARLVLGGGLSAGDLLVFMTYLKSAFRPMRDFAKYTARLAKATAAGERVLELLEREPEIRDRPGAQVIHRARGALRFEGVSFGYAPDQPVLRGLEFEVAPGETVALVGASGSGKSTLASLLLRLYDPQQGRITLDGCDLRDLKLAALRAQFGVVLQESVLFGSSIRENLVLGQDDPGDAALTAAARLANAHDFIAALPGGYDTPVGERGATLSGGQRQRLAVARAALRNAPLLVLDEPTAALDEENERLVRSALLELARRSTTLLITHDLDFAARADRVLVLEAGRVAEAGSHRELLAQEGRYAALQRLGREEAYALG